MQPWQSVYCKSIYCKSKIDGLWNLLSYWCWTPMISIPSGPSEIVDSHFKYELDLGDGFDMSWKGVENPKSKT